MDFWTRLWHNITQWRYFELPAPETVDVFKSRRQVSKLQPIDWPALFTPLSAGLGKAHVGRDGIGSGNPMQNGLEKTRRITWGYAEWGRQEFAQIPLPKSGWYWTGGYPNPAWDRHCIIAAPNGDVHELIQFEPNAPARGLPWPNQALGWGRWQDGKLVEGKTATATDLPMHPYVWGPGSASSPHELAIVLPDYVGADGLLETGPKAGSRLALNRDSESYRKAKAQGGDCAIAAEALAKYGCVIIDRNGYSDSPNNRTTRGTKPHPPGMLRQAGDRSGNTHLLRVTLTDFLEVIA